MKKTSREYAEKLALEMYPQIEDRWNRHLIITGYLKAVEETNVKELIEALENLKSKFIKDGIQTGHLYQIADNALNKTKP